MKSEKSYILCIKKKDLLKNIKQHNDSINLYNRLDDVFMNSKNSKTSDPHRNQ